MRRSLLVCLLAAVVALVGAAAARADGDPASDYLLANPSFVPPDIGVPPAYATQLDAVLRSARAGGYEIRVALIGSRYDMGSVTSLYGKPVQYAHFLGQELYFVYKGKLLVVMRNGVGASSGGKPQPAMQAVVDRLPKPAATGGGAALARAATRAVVRLAADNGVIVTVPPLSGRTSGTNENHDRLEIGIGVVVIALAFLAFSLLRRRTRSVRPT